MTGWKKAMSYLGLGPEDAYDDYDAPAEPERPVGRRSTLNEESGAIRTVPTRPSGSSPAARSDRDPFRPAPVPTDDSGAIPIRRPGTQGSAVRTLPAGAAGRPHTVKPRSFEQAKEVGDRFKEGQAVIVNLEGVSRELSRRLIDFGAGLCYGLGGTMERVASGVYLLTPPNVQVQAEDRRHLRDDSGFEL